MNAALNLAERAARRMSEPSTRANPPPAAGPLTAAITGCGSERRCGMRLAISRCTAKPRCVGPRWALCGGVAEAAEVEPGAEAPAGAGEDHDPGVGIDGDVVERLVQAGDQLGRHGVELGRAVEGDLHDAGLGPRDLDDAHVRDRDRSAAPAAESGAERRPRASASRRSLLVRSAADADRRPPTRAGDAPPARARRPARGRSLVPPRRGDPTTRLDADVDAPGPAGRPTGRPRCVLDWSGPLRIDAWGPGADHARAAGAGDDRRRPPAGRRCPTTTRCVTDAARRYQRRAHRRQRRPLPRPAADDPRPSGSPAARPCGSGPRLCHELGEPAPGPDLGLLLPPAPERLAGRPAWWFHPLGIEAKRARALTEVGPHRRPAVGLGRACPPTSSAATLAWSAASARGPSARCSARCAATTTPSPSATTTSPTWWPGTWPAKPRADDARMLALLEPFRGQRGRVIRLLGLAGRTAAGVRSAAPNPPDAPMVTRPVTSDLAPTSARPAGRPPDRPRRRPDAAPRRRRPAPRPVGARRRRPVTADRALGRGTAPSPSASPPSSCPACACSPAPACGPARSPSTPTTTSNPARARRSAWSPACSRSGTASGTWRSSAAATPARSRRTSRTSSSRPAPPSSRCTRCSCGSLDRVLPGGDTLAALGVNFVLAVAGRDPRRRTSPGGCSTPTSPSGRWSCSPCSPGRSCCRTPTPRRCSSSSPRCACGSCSTSAGCSPASPRRWPRRPARTASPSSRPAPSPRSSPSTRRRDWWSLDRPAAGPDRLRRASSSSSPPTPASRWPWFRVQREAWREGTSFGATAISNTLSFLTHPLASPTDALTAASLGRPRCSACGACGASACRGRWSPTSPSIVALMLLPATVTARPRFLFTAFPLFISAAAWWPRRDRAIWDLMLVACGAGLVGPDHALRRLRRDPVTPRRCLSVVMPCYNERATVAHGRRAGAGLAVDGRGDHRRRRLDRRHPRGPRRGSTDDRLRVIHHDRNRGKGAALRTGFAAATAEYVIVQDADLEYDPAEYATMLEPLEAGAADVVFGSRFLSGRPHRVLYFWHSVGNRMLTLLSNMFTDLNLTDMETCYKAFRREVLEQIDDRGGPLRRRARDHGEGGPRPVAHLRGRHRLRRADLRRGQEDRLARRHAGRSCASCATRRSASGCAGRGSVRRLKPPLATPRSRPVTRSRSAPAGDEQHRLDDDPARHLRLAVAAGR